MRGCYYTHPEPSRAVRIWLEEHFPEPVEFRQLLETGDAPPDVLAWCQACVDGVAAWEDGAKDRPLTWALTTSKFRLFDGPWISPREFTEVLTANIDGLCYAADVMEIYGRAADAGRIEECRHLAALFYERHRTVNKLNAALVKSALKLDNVLRKDEEDECQT